MLAEERHNGTLLTHNSTGLGTLGLTYTHSWSNDQISLLDFHTQEQFHSTYSSVSADRNHESLTSRQTVPVQDTGGALYWQHHGKRWNTITGADADDTRGISYDYSYVTRVLTRSGGTLLEHGAFGQADITFGPARFFAGIRHQFTGQRGETFVSPNGGVAVGLKNFRLRASGYRSFRAPMLNELYRPFRVGNAQTLANPDLVPEGLVGVEAGVDWTAENTTISLTLFRNELNNLIDNATLRTRPNFILRQRENFPSALSRGVETNINHHWTHWTAEAGYLYADARLATGQRIPEVPKQQGTAQISFNAKNTIFSGGIRSFGRESVQAARIRVAPAFRAAASHGPAFRCSLGRQSPRPQLSGGVDAISEYGNAAFVARRFALERLAQVGRVAAFPGTLTRIGFAAIPRPIIYMDAIPLPEYEIVDLENVAPGISGVRILFVNVYGIASEGGGWTLIDSGLYLSASKIKSWAEDHFGKGNKPRAIILTHGHFDHVGTIEDLLKEWSVPVYAHSSEFPYLTGQIKYPPPDPSVGGGLMAVMSPLFPRTSADIRGRIQALPADGSVPTMPGWRWLHTPGHAPGHISLFRESDRVLLPGDAFCTTDQKSFLAVATQKPELNGPPAYYTPDWDAARESVRQLAALRPLTIAPGHGQPISGEQVPDQLANLAADFDRIARPEHGKYARAQ